MSPRLGAVAYQGEAGAYSDEAAQTVRPGARTIGHETFGSTFKSLLDRKVDAAVIPVENSLAGIVQEVNDLLWDSRLLTVVGEYVHPVRHCLLGHGEPVKRAISHPQALAQCRRWLADNNVEAVPFMDTAGAARQVAESQARGLGAIASKSAAKRYGLQIIAEEHQESPRLRHFHNSSKLPGIPAPSRRRRPTARPRSPSSPPISRGAWSGPCRRFRRAGST